MANTRRHVEGEDPDAERRDGKGVDSSGGPVVDPTTNVGNLVKAEAQKRDELREADKELSRVRIDALKDQVKILAEGIVQYQNGQRDAETRRIDQLAENRQEFQNTIRDMLAESVRTTSTLVSTQLVQIQATFDTRVSKLEAFQFTQAGRSSVSDPALSDSMTRMTLGLSSLNTKQDDALISMTKALSVIQNAESRSGGTAMGREAGNARFFAIVMAIAAVAGPIIAVSGTIMAMKSPAPPQVIYAPVPAMPPNAVNR